MSERPPKPSAAVPLRSEMEQRFDARVVTFDDGGIEKPGGMCSCCGSGPNPHPDWRAEPWYVYKAGICDADGVYFSMLCEGCLEDIRFENAKRVATDRDHMAREITELLGDDIDGAQTMMDDWE